MKPVKFKNNLLSSVAVLSNLRTAQWKSSFFSIKGFGNFYSLLGLHMGVFLVQKRTGAAAAGYETTMGVQTKRTFCVLC